MSVKCLGTFIISRPTSNCSRWWKFVYTECCHDVTLRASNANVQRRNAIFLKYLSSFLVCQTNSLSLSEYLLVYVCTSRFLLAVYVYSIGFTGAKGFVWLSFYVVYLPVLYRYYFVSSTYRAATLVYNVVIKFTDGWVSGSSWVVGVHPSTGHSRRWASIVVGEDICKEIIIAI